MRGQTKHSYSIIGLMLSIIIVYQAFSLSSLASASIQPFFLVGYFGKRMEGFGFTPNGQVQIEVYISPGGSLVTGPVSFQADDAGEFVTPNISIFAPGMFIRVTDQTSSVIKELVVQPIKITSIDVENDCVIGIAPPNVYVSAVMEDPVGTWNWGIRSLSDDNGNFSVSFVGILDVQPYHQATAFYDDEDGDKVETAPGEHDLFHLQGGYDFDWMEFYYYLPSYIIDYQILDDQGNILSSGQTPTNEQGWGYINFADHGVELQPGYQIVGINHLTNLSDTITLQDISTTDVDYGLSYVAGTAPPDTDLKIMVGIEDGGAGSIYHFDVHSDLNGNWSSYLMDDFGYELTLDTWVYAELSDTNFNTTFAALDQDNDAAINGIDNAMLTFNPDQSDLDADSVGDVEDPCPNNFDNSCDANRSGAVSINQLGGVLTTPEGGTSISIPAGSLSKDTSISITDTGVGYPWEGQSLLAASASPETWAVFSNFIGPSPITVTLPVSITFRWDDLDDDGIVDRLGIEEDNLTVLHNGIALTGACSIEPACHPDTNRIEFTATKFGDYALVGEKTVYWVFLPMTIR